jgi:hypothetical protein
MRRIARDQVQLTCKEWQLLCRTLEVLRGIENAPGRGPEDGMDAWEFVETFERLSDVLERLVVKHQPVTHH